MFAMNTLYGISDECCMFGFSVFRGCKEWLLCVVCVNAVLK